MPRLVKWIIWSGSKVRLNEAFCKDHLFFQLAATRKPRLKWRGFLIMYAIFSIHNNPAAPVAGVPQVGAVLNQGMKDCMSKVAVAAS